MLVREHELARLIAIGMGNLVVEKLWLKTIRLSDNVCLERRAGVQYRNGSRNINSYLALLLF